MRVQSIVPVLLISALYGHPTPAQTKEVHKTARQRTKGLTKFLDVVKGKLDDSAIELRLEELKRVSAALEREHGLLVAVEFTRDAEGTSFFSRIYIHGQGLNPQNAYINGKSVPALIPAPKAGLPSDESRYFWMTHNSDGDDVVELGTMALLQKAWQAQYEKQQSAKAKRSGKAKQKKPRVRERAKPKATSKRRGARPAHGPGDGAREARPEKKSREFILELGPTQMEQHRLR